MITTIDARQPRKKKVIPDTLIVSLLLAGQMRKNQSNYIVSAQALKIYLIGNNYHQYRGKKTYNHSQKAEDTW